jgi:hypothetical protein
MGPACPPWGIRALEGSPWGPVREIERSPRPGTQDSVPYGKQTVVSASDGAGSYLLGKRLTGCS